MSYIAVKTFRGEAPRYAPRKLSKYGSQKVLSCDLWSREIRSLRDNIQVNIPTKSGTIKTIYKLGSLWLHWNEDVDVARSPVSKSSGGRVYYSGHYNPKATDETLAASSGTDYPTDWYRLGLPSPDTAASVSTSGGSGVNQTRTYVYTYVTAWGEESPPSPPSTEVTGPNDATWTVSGMDGLPLNSGSISTITVSGSKATVVTTANHFLETGDYVSFSGVSGTGDLPSAFNNAGYVQVTRVDTVTFTVNLAPAGSHTGGTGSWSREADIQTTGLKKRIYRSVLGQFRYVGELSDAAITSFTDTVDDADLGEEIPSTEWVSPPYDMKGMIVLPNGSLCGFKGNTLSFSEPFVPHAWPAKYDITFAYEIVAIAASGSSIIVGTKGNPYIVFGNDPGDMTPSELEVFQACVSKRSMVSIVNGAIYASPDGLVYVPVSGMPQVITSNWFKEVDWRLLNPSSMHCYKYDDRYYAIYTGGGEDGSESGLIVFDPSETESTVTRLSIQADAGHTQLEEDRLYFLEDGVIKEFNKGGGFEFFTWRSKKFTLPKPVRMQAAQVKFSSGDGIVSSEITNAYASAIATLESQIFFPNGDPINDEPSVSGAFGGHAIGAYAVGGGPYVDATKSITTNAVEVNLKVITGETDEKVYIVSDSRPFRINVGEMSDILEFEVTGTNATIHEVIIAESMSEIARV